MLASYTCLNPFTVPTCKISGLKDARMHLQTGLQLIYFQILEVLMKVLFHASAKKETKRLNGFKFDTFIGRFQVNSNTPHSLLSAQELRESRGGRTGFLVPNSPEVFVDVKQH